MVRVIYLFLKFLTYFSLTECKVTYHLKCYKKADPKCVQDGPKPVIVGTGATPSRNRVFAVPLELLVRAGGKIPLVVDRLITCIELYGLYTEGLYRKSGAQTKVSYVLSTKLLLLCLVSRENLFIFYPF